MGGDIKQIISLVFLGLVGLLALVGALKGLSRGIKRQTVRTVTIILSIVLSFVVVKVLYGVVLGFFDGVTMAELFVKLEEMGMALDYETQEMLQNLDPVILEYILAIPLALIIGPVVFMLVFIIISAIMWIVHAIVCGIVGFRKKQNNALTRLLGMALGLVQGVLVSIVLLVPIIGLASTVSDAVETIRANENKSEADVELINMYDTELKDVIENPTVKILGKLGGNLMYKMLATVKVEENSVKMVDQIDTVLVVYGELDTLSSLEFTNLTPEQQASVTTLIDAVGDSNYFAPLLSKLVSSVATMVEGDMVAEMEEPIKTLMVDILAIFKTSTQESIKTDLNTFCDFFFYLTNRDVLEAAMGSENPDAQQPDIMDVLFRTDESNGKTTIDNAIAILDSNPRTQPIISSLVKISVAYAKESLKESTEGAGMPELDGVEIEEVYNSVKEGINEIVKIDRTQYATEEEYKGAVSNSVESFIVDNGFVEQSQIDENREEMEEIFAEVSDHIIENFAGQEEVSDAELISVVLEYYNSYANSNVNGGSTPEIPGGLLPEG
ncbi:MAG: hypothetical protein IJW38_05520 [Clostridia bacterium]|nr:hypothetical protein [Clostridia bacterium]